MKVITISICLSLLVSAAVSAPADDSHNEDQSELGVRLPRATCDIGSLSIAGVSLNHSACTVHCLALGRGFRDGRCRDGVCHCRK